MGIVNLLSLTGGIAIGTQIGLRASCALDPRPLPHQFAALLDHPARLKLRDPARTAAVFGYEPGMTVLEVGSGTGAFTVELAQLAGPTGRVHAVEIQKEMIDKAAARIREAGVSDRVRFEHRGIYRLPMQDASVDLAVLMAVLSEIPDRSLALAEVRRVLKPEGRLVVGEEVIMPSYLPPKTARALANGAGFRFGGHSGTPICYTTIFFKE